MSGASTVLAIADRATLVGIGLGLALLLEPWFAGGLEAGFFVTLAATVAQVVTSHLLAQSRSPRAE